MPTAIEKTIKVGKLFRSFIVERAAVNKDKRTVDLSFSSEAPVERWFGYEILDHGKSAVDMTRLKRGGALLIDHDMKNQVGVIEEATIGADRMGRAVVRFGRSAKAEEIFQDVVDGIRSNVSVGYQIDEMVLEKEAKDAPSTYRAVRWTPFEISLVAVPADISVGVGREASDGKEIRIAVSGQRVSQPECHSMDGSEDPMMEPMADPEDCTQGADCMNTRCSSAAKAVKKTIPKEVRKMPDPKKVCDACGIEMVDGKCPNTRHEEVANALARMKNMDSGDMEKVRQKAITNLCEIYKVGENFRQMFIGQGLTVEQSIDEIRKISEERARNSTPATIIGLSPTETNRFSLIRAIQAVADQNWKNAPFELEVSRAVSQKLNRMNEPTKFFVPYEVMQRPIMRMGADGGSFRDATVGTTSAGGYLVQTTNVGFIEQLYNRSVCMRMGATRLDGLIGNVAIPKQVSGSTAYWLTNEATQATETNLVFAQVSLTPKNVAAYVEISRQLMLQSSPGAEGIVSSDLAAQVAVAADLAALEGAGAPAPTGIANTASIGSFTGATLSYAAILNAQEDVAGGNITPISGGYVATPAVASLCMQRVKFTSTASPLWEGNLWDGSMAGFKAMSTNQLTAGTMIFGAWEALVMASWGVLEIDINPFANFQAGIVGVRAMYSMDVAVRRAAAFSRATSIT